MRDAITYRLMQPADAEQVSELICASFDQFIAPEYDAEGIAAFRRYTQPDAIRARSESGSHFVMVAEAGGRVAGITEFRDCNHVALLFVGRQFHRRGIARGLFDRALRQARATRPDLERVTTNSTRYGVEAYEKLGFRQTGPERSVNGILFVPLAMRLDSQVGLRPEPPAATPEGS